MRNRVGIVLLAVVVAAGAAYAQQREDARAAAPVNPYGMTPLHQAVEAGDAQAVRRLIAAGGNVNAMTRYGVSPLSIAATRGDIDSTRALLEAGANANAVMGDGEPVLMTASRLGHVGVVKALIAGGADVNVRERLYGQLPLMWAAIENHVDVIKALVEGGAAVNARANILEGEPTWRYGKDGRTGVFGESLQNFNTSFPKGGLTPLLFAARQGAADAVRALIDLGADPGFADPEGFTPLLVAIMNAQYDTAAVLIEKGADVNQADRSGQRPLFAVADVRSLLWSYNRPAPVAPSRLSDLELAELLLEKGAKVDAFLGAGARRPMGGGGTALTGKGATAFHRAAVTSDLPLMRLLLAHGADPKATTEAGVNALHMAAGLRWNEQNMSTSMARGFASEEDSIEAIALLIEKGVDVNAVDGLGATALHGAAVRGADKVVQFLVDRGARLDLKTTAGAGRGLRLSTDEFAPPPVGRTPLDEAENADPARPSTVALLKKLMGL